MNTTSGIYQILNTRNGHRYIGSAINFKRREVNHWWMLKRGDHYNPHLQNAWNKYGDDTFEFEALMTCHPTMCIWYEQQFLDRWKPKYNICLVAGSRLGHKPSNETKAKISAALTGKKYSDETRARLSKALTGNMNCLGNKHSATSKAKISTALKGHKHSEEAKAKMSTSHAGVKLSKERCARMSMTFAGENNPNSRLSKGDVHHIRRLYTTGLYTQKVLGHRFGITWQHVRAIVNHRTWKHI